MAEKKPTVFPDWAEVGADVLVGFNTRREADFRPGKIVRLTKTQIVVEQPQANGTGTYTTNFYQHKWGNGDWQAVGYSGGHYSGPRLFAADEPKVKVLLAQAQLNDASRAITKKAEAFSRKGKDATVEDAQTLISELASYIGFVETFELPKEE
jgi:hypothetical protein